MRGEDGAAERDCVAIVQDAIDVGGRKLHGLVVRRIESRFCRRIRPTETSPSMTSYFAPVRRLICGAAGAVVVVGVADEQDFDVAEIEAERFDALADLRRGRCEIAVDEDVALRRDDEVGGEIFAADVVEIAGDAERREGLGPGGIDSGARLRLRDAERCKTSEQKQECERMSMVSLGLRCRCLERSRWRARGGRRASL